MKNLHLLLASLFICYLQLTEAQEPIPRFDSICVIQGDLLFYDLSANDLNPQGPIILQDPTGCFSVDPYYHLIWSPGPGMCPCGETYVFQYFYESNPAVRADISITIKCGNEKPECFLNNLDDVPDPGSGGPPTCLYACEYSSATYFVPHVSGNSYSWVISGDVSNATNVAGNEIYIEWGASGTGNINLTITNGGISTTKDVCVEILDGPIASFTKSTDCVCLNGPISFVNTSIGGNSYLWDFGDGNTDVNPNPTHTYDAPGTYTVILYAFKNNQNDQGDPLCCCSDSTSMEVTVDPNEGPNIYWISTLCPGDKSYYWTDATGCGLYDWKVFDENGDPLIFTMVSPDSICVTWGDGPFGTVSLAVTGCDQTYCTKPSVALVPIISSISNITGEDEVCIDATETYTLPKWPNVYYDWSVTGGTLFPGDNGSNSVTIMWGSGPTGTIHVDYSSEFLGGLPGHDPNDCSGIADLTVSILPAFSITGPNPHVACVNTTSNFSATASPSSSYNWYVTPAAPLTGDGTANVMVDWVAGPGTFIVTAVTNSPSSYCNDTVNYAMTIVEVPIPDSIVGPIKICPNQTYTYLGYGSTPNTSLEWTVQGGSPNSYSGSPITVTWDASGPYSISLAQMQASAPNCISDTITLGLMEKEINGPLSFSAGPACINTVESYSTGTMQDDEAVLEWKISPATRGSVISGQGTLNPMIQWNNDPGMVTLTYCVTLCGQTQSHMETFMLHAPAVPTIVQVGDLCPGQNAILDATSGFSTYVWKKGGVTQGGTEDLTITTGGTYELTTTDGFGCQTTVSYTAIALPGPVASITTPDPKVLCLPAAGEHTKLYAQTNPNYEFTWYCNSVIVQGPSDSACYTHVGTNAIQNFSYCVVVKDLMTQCTTKSNTIVVVQDTCSGTGNPCIPEMHNFDVALDNSAPTCDIADFMVTSSPNVILGSWNFGDPVNNTNTGTTVLAQHQYSKAGYYTATLSATVPTDPPTIPVTYCTLSESVSVCVPLAADFSYVDDCMEVCFSDLSTFLPDQDITSWLWDFGDSNSSMMEDPCHEYALPGTYSVTLTVSNDSMCVATKTISVLVLGPPSATVTINPNPACVGDPISFIASGSGIIDWLWDFGDLSTNGAQNPSHTYLSDNTYNVTLIVTDGRGCMDTIISPVVVHPNPADDTISYSPSLVICEGTSVTLSAPPGPYTYQWSNGLTGPSINVSIPGDFHVTVTDAQNCMMVTDPVTVVVIPPPTAAITGPNFICDDGCVTLSATAGPGFSYEWLDAAMDPISISDTNQTYDICDFMTLPMTVFVKITDENGCESIAGPHTVDIASSPSFVISTVGDLCEGSVNILSVPVLANVRYQWSTGESGNSIAVILAGTYTVIGTDTTTNCSHAESVVINPLPDLCIVPTGCYEVCNPDTLCGPDGLTSYQWNMNGSPIPGATSQCYIVTVTGSYSLTGTNEFNCSLTSDTLILDVIECTDCVDQDVTANSIQGSDCCFSLSYNNAVNNIYGLMMHTGDADIDPDLISLDPSLNVFTIGSNYIGLVNSTSGSNLPTGSLNNYLEFCLTNITNVPQTIIFDWYNDSLDIVCSDTLIFDCPISSDCIYIVDDTIYCEGDQVFYEFTVCNANSNTFIFNYITLDPVTPPGIIISPTFFDISANALLPGDCRTFSITLSGAGIANETFCFNAIGHLSDPAIDPNALCCSLDTLRCIQIPGCTPCDMVYVTNTIIDDSSCCQQIELVNNFDDNTFTGVRICALTSGTSLSIDNPFGSDWLTTSFTPTVIDLLYDGTTTLLPLGSTMLPDICIQETSSPEQLIEIKWMKGQQIQCTDTIITNCDPPCGYIFDDSVYCGRGNDWIFQGFIKNTSLATMSTAHIIFQDASLSGYNQSIALGSLPPGGTFGPFFINIASPAMSGENICFDVVLHEIGHNDQHENCCVFRHCIDLPDCGQSVDCLCDHHFEMQVEAGFNCTPGAGLTYSFSPLGGLMLCDQARWTWDDGSPPLTVLAPSSVLHTFPSPGSYEVCMTVVRTDINGKKCKARFCKEVEIIQRKPNLFPNPARESLTVEWKPASSGVAKINIYTTKQLLVGSYEQVVNSSELVQVISIQNLTPGVYFVVVELNENRWLEKLVVY